MKRITAEQYRGLCLEKGIVLSPQIVRNLPGMLEQSGMVRPTRVSHWWITVKDLFPRTGRSDPNAKYRFNKPKDAISHNEIDDFARRTRSGAAFRSGILEMIRPKPEVLRRIQRVTHAMIRQRIVSNYGAVFSQSEILSLLLRVDFPEPPSGDYCETPESELWMRVMHEPFLIGQRAFQICFGRAKDGSKRVELIAYDPEQGFVSSEYFYYKCI